MSSTTRVGTRFVVICKEMLPVFSTIRRNFINPNYGATMRFLNISAIDMAARKGTREKARKKKVKVEVQKVGFIPHNLRETKIAISRVNKHVDDSWKQIPTDNAYFGRYYRWKVYTIDEAIESHRESHHPTMYNVPDAPLNVTIELNTVAEKANRYVDNFNRMATVPHRFDHGEERKILVFTKDDSHYAEARDAGATLVGGLDLIKDVQTGELLLADYQYIIAHTNILADLVILRGLMKRRFPNPKSGTLGTDLKEMVHRFSNGIAYSAVKDEHQKDFGLITACVGTIDMDKKKLEENIIALIKDVDSVRPKREGKFVTRVLLKSPPSREQFKIDPFLYISENYQGKITKKSSDESNEDDEVDAVAN